MTAAGRYQVVRAGFWWKVKIGNGDQKIGRFYTETKAERFAAHLMRAFHDGEFVGKSSLVIAASTVPQDEFAGIALQRMKRELNRMQRVGETLKKAAK